MRMLAAAVLLALILAAPAAAHVNIRPTLLASGQEILLRIEVPDLRPGMRPTALDLSGPGVRVLSSAASGPLGEESRWRVRIRLTTAPGPLPLTLLTRYADGRSVTIHQTLTVIIPARTRPKAGFPFLLVALGLGGLLVAVAAALNFKKKSRTAC